MGSVSVSLSSALSSSILQALGKGRLTGGGNVAISDCAHLPRGVRDALTVRNSSLPSRHDVSRVGELSIGSRSRGIGPVRAINSAQYRLDKEKEKEQRQEEDDEDDDLCPVECVREFSSQAEFDELLGQAKEQGSLVVVDFFRTACGSCKYIEKGFIKLCKGAGNNDAHVMFLKHNVMDEYDEQSEIADRLRIKVVPLFHFYKDGVLVESFPTREKSKILQAICKHTDLTLDDLDQSGL